MFGLAHCQWLLRALWFKWANLKPLDSKSDANKIERCFFFKKNGFDFICSSESRDTDALMRSNKPTSQDADSRILTVCIRFEFQIGHSIVKFSFSNKAKKDLPNLLHGFDIYLVNVKTMKKITQIFVVFSDKLIFLSFPACF